jgi:hypothetical protein
MCKVKKPKAPPAPEAPQYMRNPLLDMRIGPFGRLNMGRQSLRTDLPGPNLGIQSRMPEGSMIGSPVSASLR